MKITIHRGSREVGGNCLEIQSGETRLIFDVGLPLFAKNREPLDTFSLRRLSTAELQQQGILPAVLGLFDGAEQPAAILLSHAHLDHTGLLDHTQKTIPVYASQGTSKMMLAGKLFAHQVELPRDRHRLVIPEVPFPIGPFTITGFSVDHSIYGCLAYLIAAEGKTVLYAGDLRSHGRKPGMQQKLLQALQHQKIHVLVMEGTHLSHPDYLPVGEYELETEITEHIRGSHGLVLGVFSPQHVDRLVAFIRAAKKTSRQFVADPYTAFVLHLLKNEIPTLPQPELTSLVRVYVPQSLKQSNQLQRLKLLEKFQKVQIELETIRNSPEKFVMLFRESMLPDFGETFPENTVCLHSRWQGYLEHPNWEQIRAQLQQSRGELKQVHTSGHIAVRDIIQLVKKMAPETLIPIHTFEPEKFQEHFENVVLLQDGIVFEIPV